MEPDNQLPPSLHDRLREALRDEADRHEPDRTLIMARLEAGRRHAPVPPGHLTPRGRLDLLGRGSHLWLASAAAVVAGVATVTWTLRADGPGPESPVGSLSSTVVAPAATTAPKTAPTHVTAASSPATTVPTHVPATSSPATTAPTHVTATSSPATTGAPTHVPAASSPATIAPVTAPSVVRPSATTTAPGATTATSAPPALALPTMGMTSVAGDVEVPGSIGTLGWAVVGARKDGVVVLAKAPAGAVSAPQPAGGTPVVETAPFTVSWTGGAPEQSHSRATTWSTLPAADGSWRTVVRPPGGGTLHLLVGTSGGSSRLRVEAALTGAPTASWVTGSVAGGVDVAVSWNGAPPGSTLTVTVSVFDGSATRLGMSVAGLG